jgi:hypothetical protein
MKTNDTSSLRFGRLVALTVSALALLAIVAPRNADASADPATSPCPSYSIQDVFDDPNSDWDRDRVNNKDELYNNLNPCTYDTDTFCGTSGNVLCRYGAYGTTVPTSLCYSSNWAWADVYAAPNADWDRDAITNLVEARNGLNPCVHSCKNLTQTDVNLNPDGSWDIDGVSNRTEVNQGTNPCNGYDFNPCPNWSTHHIGYMPNADWDRDGITNTDEIRHGFNPCIADIIFGTLTPAPAPTATPAPVATNPAPVLAPTGTSATCPASYPYFHAGTCYANPVTPTR